MSITTPQVPTAYRGAAYNATLHATGGILPYHWAVASGALPPGISLNSSTGTLSGVATQAGNFTFMTHVSDSSTDTAKGTSRTLNLAVSSSSLEITTASLPAAQVGGTFQTVLTAAGGTPPYRWTIASGELPTGISLNAATGALSGTPSQSRQVAFSVQVSDSLFPSPETAMKSLILPVVLAMQIAPGVFPKGHVGIAFQSSEVASGGVTPYSWSVMGSLPSGLSLNSSSGTITGTPTQPTTSSFTLVLTDSAGDSVQVPSSIEIVSPPQPLSITTATLAQATSDESYTANFQAAGGTPPYTWSMNSGQLPAGLTFSSSGNLTGMPSAAGQVSFVVQVADSSSPQATVSKPLSVNVAKNPASSLDQFGGDSSHRCVGTLKNGAAVPGSTGFFYLYKDTTAKHWFFCDPAGNRFWMLGVQVVSGMNPAFYSIVGPKYTSASGGWPAQEAARLKSIGFNTIGEYANLYMWPLPTYGHGGNANLMPFIYTVTPGIDYYKYGIKDVVYNLPPAYKEYRGETFPDVFDPLWTSTDLPTYFSDTGSSNPFRGSGGYTAADASPYIIGTTLDDSDALWGFKGLQGAYPHLAWMVWMMPPYMGSFADTTVHMKQQFASFLQAKYGTISALNAAWGSNYTSFGSSAVTVKGETIGTGTGSQTSFSHKLSQTPADPDSVTILVGGAPIVERLSLVQSVELQPHVSQWRRWNGNSRRDCRGYNHLRERRNDSDFRTGASNWSADNGDLSVWGLA